MAKLTVKVSVGLVGCRKAETIEVEDDLSEQEQEEIARETLWSMIDWGFDYEPEREQSNGDQ